MGGRTWRTKNTKISRCFLKIGTCPFFWIVRDISEKKAIVNPKYKKRSMDSKEIQKFKMTDPKWWTKNSKKKFDVFKNCCVTDIWVVRVETEFKI